MRSARISRATVRRAESTTSSCPRRCHESAGPVVWTTPRGYHQRSMAPKDGDPPPNAASSAAFAATVAPTDMPTPPEKLAGGTVMEHDSGLEATVAAPPSNNPKDAGTAEAPLPEVSASNYQLDR